MTDPLFSRPEMTRRLLMGAAIALPVAGRLPIAADAASPLEAAIQNLRLVRRAAIEATLSGAAPGTGTSSPVFRIMAATGRLREAARHEGLTPQQYRAAFRLAWRLARRDCRHLRPVTA